MVPLAHLHFHTNTKLRLWALAYNSPGLLPSRLPPGGCAPHRSVQGKGCKNIIMYIRSTAGLARQVPILLLCARILVVSSKPPHTAGCAARVWCVFYAFTCVCCHGTQPKNGPGVWPRRRKKTPGHVAHGNGHGRHHARVYARARLGHMIKTLRENGTSVYAVHARKGVICFDYDYRSFHALYNSAFLRSTRE